MDDNAILDLFRERSEDAIVQVQIKYGNYCRSIRHSFFRGGFRGMCKRYIYARVEFDPAAYSRTPVRVSREDNEKPLDRPPAEKGNR